MTDNEIVIALRAVAEKYKGKFVRTFETNINAMATDAADRIESLCNEINRREAEIERLQKENERFEKEFDSYYARVKSEARKELAERLKAEIDIRPTHSKEQNKYVFFLIDNLVKEMEQETNERKI